MAYSTSQRDARAQTLLQQGHKQKSELERMIKAAFAHPSFSTGPSSSSRPRAHVKDSGHKLLDSELEFARRNLRNTYLNLLFTCTFTREAQSADGLIWTNTSYNIITAYRSYLSAAEKTVDSAVQAPGRRGKLSHDTNRVKNEFRKFLAEDEAFWHDLVARLARLFSLDEARANLESLGINVDSDGDTTVASSLPPDSLASRSVRQANEPDEALSQAALLPAKRAHLIAMLHHFLIFCGDLSRYREIASHEVDGADASAAQSSDSARRSSMRTSKTAARPKYDLSRASAFYEQARLILPDQGNPSNQLAVVSTYNADTFASLYHYYRALCVKTPFTKAKINLEKLFVKPTAHYLDHHRSDDLTWDAEKDAKARDSQLVETLASNVTAAEELATSWTKQVIVLHGLFFQRSHLNHVMYLSKSVLATFSTLVRARALRADQIVRFLVTALSASWTTRLWRSAPGSAISSSHRPASGSSDDRQRPRAIRSERSSRRRAPSPETGRCVEFQVLAHVLGIFQELAEIDTSEVRDAIDANTNGHDAEAAATTANSVRHLTAVVRRTLPALRIMTKWTKTHLEYMQRVEKRASEAVETGGDASARSSMEADPKSDHIADHQSAYADTLSSISRCWSSYVALINNLRFAFPFDTLPNIGKVGSVGAPALCLEEDSDMRGFAPTRKATQSTVPGGTIVTFGMGEVCANVDAVRPSQVHPNEEQLMRIADLLIDAKVIAESDASPIQFDDQQNVFVHTVGRASQSRSAATAAAVALRSETARANPQRPRADAGVQESEPARDDASSEGNSEMTDDPVEMAMRAVDGRRTVDSTELGSVEQSLQSVSVADQAPKANKGGDRDLLIPAQVKARGFAGQPDLTKQLFDAYPVPSSGAAMGSSSSGGTGTVQQSSNAQELYLQMLGQRSVGQGFGGSAAASGSNSGSIGQQESMLLPNGAAISSIWALSPADVGVSTAGAGSQMHVGVSGGFQQHSQVPMGGGHAGQPGIWNDAMRRQSGPNAFSSFSGYGNSPSQQATMGSSAYQQHLTGGQAAFSPPSHMSQYYGSGGSGSSSLNQSPMTPTTRTMGPAFGTTGARNSPFSDPYYPGPVTGASSPAPYNNAASHIGHYQHGHHHHPHHPQ
ncbi:hypothetical protein BCV70DRAFT_199502 [Testicularia cyperi]|uniref:DNA/RNA-binding domain-containing protein n=1 Tax=Testicularia cyperi TaxID=1882483 RepID=A0A317XRZ9_9BASI|nr:hypothetical protein BCV70DRAFT_199502 [Testicularia cyperi]